MSPHLKPLLLPQLVQERRNKADCLASLESPDLSQVHYIASSSSSDITSPLTPTFSPKGHQRFPSSSSSLDLPPQPPQDSPVSPTAPYAPVSAKSEKRQLPDVQEDPMELYEDDSSPYSESGIPTPEPFGPYGCLCGHVYCQHRSSSEGFFVGDVVGELDFDYDLGFLSDNDCAADGRRPNKMKALDGSPFAGLTTRLGSRLTTLKRWQASRRSNLAASPTAELSLENVLSCGPSSRSSSLSASKSPDRLRGSAVVSGLPSSSATLSLCDSTDDLGRSSMADMTLRDQTSLERDRALATTPLLPPLLTSPLGGPPPESPLQSPTVASPPTTPSLPATPQPPQPPYSRPSLSSRPSTTSLRLVPTATGSGEPPLPLPTMLQEHDEWSDRLGHANFTILPLPYEPDALCPKALDRFRKDWDAARVNYTKHLVRTGEHYGQTSNIYALTEAKWAETELRWKAIYDDFVYQSSRSAPASASHSRSHSRGRRRGRSSSSVALTGRGHSHDDSSDDVQWRRVHDGLPSVVPRMLESLDAQGKFPCRGDEDIVGPMHRDAFMLRARSEDAKGHFWRSLVDKVAFRK